MVRQGRLWVCEGWSGVSDSGRNVPCSRLTAGEEVELETAIVWKTEKGEGQWKNALLA